MSEGKDELALRPTAAIDAYEPASYDQAIRMATDFAGSKLTKCRTKEQAILVMATGHDLGISATAALRMIYVADFGQGDQVTLSADLMVALCLRDKSRCEYFRCLESTAEIATYETKRAGDPPRKQSFTADDAKRAKLGSVGAGKDATLTNWAKYPATMLKHRAASMLAREVYPDLLGGFYTEDELREVAATVDAPILQSEIIETTIVDSETPAARMARWTAALAASPSKVAAKPIIDEAMALGKDDPDRKALREMVNARDAAKWEIVSGETGEVTTREPGEEG